MVTDYHNLRLRAENKEFESIIGGIGDVCLYRMSYQLPLLIFYFKILFADKIKMEAMDESLSTVNFIF